MGTVTGAFLPSGAPAWAASVATCMRAAYRRDGIGSSEGDRECGGTAAHRKKKGPRTSCPRASKSEALECRNGGGDQNPGVLERLRAEYRAGFVPELNELILRVNA